MNMRGGTLDRVVVNEPGIVYVRMYIYTRAMAGLAIMTDNDVLQTKFIGYDQFCEIPASSISNSFHIIIDNVLTNMGTTWNDANMNAKKTTIRINDNSYKVLRGTWTSTIEPDNVTVELDCKVVKTDWNFITAKCGPDLWHESVFNRIPIRISSSGEAHISTDSMVNQALFGTNSFSIEGSITQSWDGSTRYNVTGSGTSLTFNDQVTITGLPESFVSYWVNTIHAKAYMGNDYAMLVPPE